MGRWVVTGGILVLAAVGAALQPADAGSPGRAASTPLYGVTWRGSLALVRVAPKTLRPLPGPSVRLAGEPLGWSFAPDRSRLALGSAPHGGRLRLIDLRRMRQLGDVQVTGRGSLIASAWVGPARVLAVVVIPGCCGAGDTIVAGVDARRRRVLWRRTLGGSLQAGEHLRRGVVLLLGPRGRSVGSSRLVRVSPQGSVRSAALPEIRSGTESKGRVTRSWDPGLTVDRWGGRAFVVQAEAPVVEVNLTTFGVQSHPLLPPPRTADAVTGPSRQALWLGRGMLAVTGSDAGGAVRTRPAGLTLVDTRSWRARTIDRRTSDAVLVSGTLLASSFLFDARAQDAFGSGLTGYTVSGRPRFHLFANEPITGAQPLGHTALVGMRDRIVLIDARTGRRLRSYRRLTTSLLVGDASFH